MSSSLAITAETHQELQQHLFPGDGLESAAILLCHRSAGIHGFRLTVQELIRVPSRECSKRTEVEVIWPFADHMPPERIESINEKGLSILTVHSHPDGVDRFSRIDNDNDRSLFSSVCNWFDDKRPHGSAIMVGENGKMVARTCDGKGNFHDIDAVSVVGENISVWKREEPQHKILGSAKRISQTFGKGTLDLLRQLRVGVVGCSGTGSIVVELLARNCIGKLVLVDPDRVEEKNLNRIVNARMDDALNDEPKVLMLKKAVEAMGTGVTVETYFADTFGDSVLEALTDCDVLFGCVDSATGRYHLNSLASACLIPYFDVGVYLKADENSGISYANATAHYVHPESASLMERGVFTPEQLAAEDTRRVDPDLYEKRRNEGYLQGVDEDQPAVISVNMVGANMAINDFLARLHRFRLDDNADFAVQRVDLVNGYYSRESVPSPDAGSLFWKYAGMGDKSLLVRNIKNSRSK